MIAAEPFSFTSVAAALLLVGVALLLSWRERLDVEKEMAWACIRAFVQLMAIGYVIHLILRTDRPIYVVAHGRGDAGVRRVHVGAPRPCPARRAAAHVRRHRRLHRRSRWG